MSKSLRVLIVEDSEDDAELVVCEIERGGYDVISERVDTAEAMLAALEKQQWDIAIADYSMPQFSAIAALKLFRDRSQVDLPLIIVSSSISDGIAVAAMKAGANDYLLKHNLARLVPAIERELQEAANRKALRESEDRWQLALRGNNDGIWDLNLKTNEVFFSSRWKKMLGYEDDEISNSYEEWEQRLHPEDLDSTLQAFQNHLAGKTLFYRTEYRLRCKDNSYKWVLARGQALWNEAGEAVRIVGSHTDISDRMAMEAALRQQAQDLVEANRLKDEFLAILSHELRTPLNPILGWAQILRSRKLNEADTSKALETIERNAKLQKQLIEDLLDVSRIIQGKLHLKIYPIDLVEVISAAAETVQAAADAKTIKLELLLEPVGVIKGDSDRLQQVVWNLLANAIKFTPAGGVVKIELTRHADPVEITVSDTGIGIKAEFLPFVFNRFRQENSSTTRAYGGLGLGLAIVRHLVELHGGTVSAHSKGENQGATFTVQLPLQPSTAPRRRSHDRFNSIC